MKLKKNIFSAKKGVKSYGQQTFFANGKIYTYGGRGEKEDQQNFMTLTEDGWKNFAFPFHAGTMLTYCSVSVAENQLMFFGGQRMKKIFVRHTYGNRKTNTDQAQRDMNNAFDLPPELVNEIVGYLNWRDMLKLSLVCKEVSTMVDPYWENHYQIELAKVPEKTRAEASDEKKFRKSLKKMKKFRRKYANVKKYIKEHPIPPPPPKHRGVPIPTLPNEFDGENIKCVLIGDGATGKTCLLISNAENRWPEEYVPTVFDNYNATVPYKDKDFSLGLWDYDTLRPLSYWGLHVFLLCFSLVDPTSLENCVTKWNPEARQHQPHAPIVLCGTKLDLREDPKILKELKECGEDPVTRQRGEKVAKDIKAVSYVETSAKTQKGIRECFDRCIEAVVESDGKKSGKDCIVQ